MTTSLPSHPDLRVDRLAAVFHSTTATYKYYWFLALLDVLGDDRREVPLRSVLVRMVSNAWYTVNYFRLSFGTWDNLQKAIAVIREHEDLSASTRKADLEGHLLHTTVAPSVTAVMGLGRYVPFKFLSPWMPSAALSDEQVMKRSQQGGVPYALYPDRIVFDERWAAYLRQHQAVLRDFCLWNLAQFLQARNPNVPQIVNKLVRPPVRAALTAQRNLGNAVLDITGGLDCIYTGAHLSAADHHIEHFIPHAFVAHDLLWNLVPAAPAFNLSKSDQLPILGRHLDPFVFAQWQFLNVARDHDLSNKVLEDYHSIVHLPFKEITDRYLFGDKLRETIIPLHSIALNNGFSELAA